MDTDEDRPKSTKSLLNIPSTEMGFEEEEAHERTVIFSFNLQFFSLNNFLLCFLQTQSQKQVFFRKWSMQRNPYPTLGREKKVPKKMMRWEKRRWAEKNHRHGHGHGPGCLIHTSVASQYKATWPPCLCHVRFSYSIIKIYLFNFIINGKPIPSRI